MTLASVWVLCKGDRWGPVVKHDNGVPVMFGSRKAAREWKKSDEVVRPAVMELQVNRVDKA